MSTHGIELPQGYSERPFDYSGDLYIEGQVRAIIEANRVLMAERDALRDALEVIKNWPVTSPLDMDAHNMAAVAQAALAQGQEEV